MKRQEYTLSDVRKEALAAQQQQEYTPSIQLIVFKLGKEEYAVPIEQIKEVVPTPRIAKMPHTAPYIKGVANIRGDIIAIMDLEERFEIDTRSITKTNHYTLVVEDSTANVGILVHQVPNTLTINTKLIDYSKEFIQYTTRTNKHIVGVIKYQDKLIVLLDLTEISHHHE